MKTNKMKIGKKRMIKKTRKNKTLVTPSVNVTPSVKILEIGYPLYASKQYEGSTILEYNKKEEEKYHDKCLMQNSSWFGSLSVAKSYKTKDSHIYKWTIKKPTRLLNITPNNVAFVDMLFTHTKSKLVPTLQLTKEQVVNQIHYDHPYLQMTVNERALYEFKFCFGFITVKEQYEFMKFLQYLIQHDILDILRRDGGSILKKLILKTSYYTLFSLLDKKEKFNRLSFYDFDKHAIMNLCKLVNNSKYKISGVYQKNDTSFWFPDLKVYKMNIEEYILFNPQDNLVYG